MRDQSQEDQEDGRTHISQVACKRKGHLWSHIRIVRKRAKLVDGFQHIRIKLAQALHSLSDIYRLGSHFSVGHRFRGEQEGSLRTNCALRRQKPTLLMASATTCSPVASRASRLRVLPSAARSLSTAASVTSSLVYDETTVEMGAVNCLFRPCEEKREISVGYMER